MSLLGLDDLAANPMSDEIGAVTDDPITRVGYAQGCGHRSLTDHGSQGRRPGIPRRLFREPGLAVLQDDGNNEHEGGSASFKLMRALTPD
jgi:hypothetical protein